MDTEKKDVKVEAAVAAPAAAPAVKAEAKKAAAKKPAAKKAAAKKPAAKKAAAKKAAPAKKAGAAKKVEIFFQIDGQEISAAAIAKKLPKAGKIYVVASEKKAYDVDGNGVDLF